MSNSMVLVEYIQVITVKKKMRYKNIILKRKDYVDESKNMYVYIIQGCV